MNKTIILGSGLIGLWTATKRPDWQLIPIKASRYYSFSPPLAINHCRRHENLDQLFKNSSVMINKSAFSHQGLIITDFKEKLAEQWLNKSIGPLQTADAINSLKTKWSSSRYSSKLNIIYKQLCDINKTRLNQQTNIKSINDHNIQTTDGKIIEFDQLISTIPLHALVKLCNNPNAHKLKNASNYCLQVYSEQLDLENCTEVYVVDQEIPFHYVNAIGNNQYLIHMRNETADPATLLSHYIPDVELIQQTNMLDYEPIGSAPDLTSLTNYGITCIGQTGSHNWSLDEADALMHMLEITV